MTTPRPIPVRPAISPEPAQHFARAAVAAAVAASGHHGRDKADVVRTLYGDDEPTTIILRAATSGATTTGWAAGIAAKAFGDFFSTLPASAASAILARATRTRFVGVDEFTYPIRANAPTALPWVGESAPIPVRAGALGTVKVAPRKFGVLSVFSREVAKRADAKGIISGILREDAALSLDVGLFSAAAGDATVHRGLLYGVTPLVASTAPIKRDAMQEDLAALAGAVAGVGGSEPIIVASPARAARAGILAPELEGRVLASAAIANTRVVAVDASALVVAMDEEPDITAGIEGTIHMETSPAHIGTAGTPNAVAAPTQSMYQTDQIALRVLGDVAWTARRTGAVAYLDGGAW